VTDIRALAIRFADLWAVDHHQMVDETYADTIHMESMAKPMSAIEGADALHRLEDALAAKIPEHRHELVRVLVDAPRAFLETTVYGPTTGEYAQAAVWWRVDGNGPDGLGRVVDEVGWFDWDHRTTDSRRSRGTIPPDDRRVRGTAHWYQAFIDRLVAAWQADPVAAVEVWLAPTVTLTRVGVSELSGRDAVKALIAKVAVNPSHWHIAISKVIGEGAVVAALFTLNDGSRQTRGTFVLTLGRDDAITSVRLYFDWGRALPMFD
jgi:limonene-1,2-epoxide hydrolase